MTPSKFGRQFKVNKVNSPVVSIALSQLCDLRVGAHVFVSWPWADSVLQTQLSYVGGRPHLSHILPLPSLRLDNILLCDIGTWVWTTCPELLPSNAPAGSRTCDLSITSPTPYHYTTEEPGRQYRKQERLAGAERIFKVRLNTIPDCDRRTDGQIDRPTSCYSILRAMRKVRRTFWNETETKHTETAWNSFRLVSASLAYQLYSHVERYANEAKTSLKLLQAVV